MATSGNFEKSITNWLKLRVEWVENSQDIANNKSNLTVTAFLVSTASNGLITASAKKSISLTINGTTYTKSDVIPNLSGAVKKKLFSKTVDVAHNANGTKSCSISCSFGIKVTLGGTYYGTVSTSGTATLDTIPRASQPSCITYPTTTKNVGDIGSTFRIHMNRVTSAFTHYVYCKWYDKTVEIGTDIESNIDWTIPADFAEDIPNNTTGNGTIYVDTYSGNSKIGTASVSFTANVPSSVKPSISALSVSEAVSGLGEKFGEKDGDGNIKKFVYVQTKSKVAVSIEASGNQKSTIKSYTTTLTNGSSVLTYNGASFTSNFLSFSGTYTIKTVVTDSRGRTAEKSTTINVVAYHPPEITSLIAYRVNEDGEKDDNGTEVYCDVAFKVAPISDKNDNYVLLEYRESGSSEWKKDSNKANIATLYEATTAEPLTLSFENASVDKAYEVRVTFQDYFTTSTRKAEVPTARTVFDILADGTGMCIGGVASKSNTCEIAMQTLFKGGQINLNAQEENDLDQFTKPNIYVSKNNASSSYENIPEGFYGTFTLEVMSAGQEGQILQRATLCSQDYPDIRERHYYLNKWGDWQKVGGIANIMTAHLSADTNTVANAYTKIPLAQEYKIGGGLSISDGAIKIGAGIKAVKVSANVEFSVKGAGGNKHIRIKKGTGDTYVAWASNSGATGKMQLITIPPKIISVSKDDLISLYYYSAAADDVINAGSTAGYKTFLTVEVVA